MRSTTVCELAFREVAGVLELAGLAAGTGHGVVRVLR